MGNKLMTELVTEQSFDPPQTAANETLKQAAAAYHNGEMTRSASLFLKGWRILLIENTNYLDGRFELLPPWNTDTSQLVPEDLARECRARVLMGYCALADLALVCLGCTGEYKFVADDGYFSYTLDCLVPAMTTMGEQLRRISTLTARSGLKGLECTVSSV